MSDQPTPGLPITVTLSLQQWRALLALLAEAPYRVSGPLIGEIERQAQPQLQSLMAPSPTNGAGAAAP